MAMAERVLSSSGSTSNDGTSSEDNQDPHDINKYLPLSLQDYCLIEIINELDRYPIELLAILPQRMRLTLLSNLPVLALGRLDNTSVSEGIDTTEIWESVQMYFSAPMKETHASLFMEREDKVNLELSLMTATGEKSRKEKILLHLLWQILFKLSSTSVNMVKRYGFEFKPNEPYFAEILNALTSVLGHEFLIKLPIADTKFDDISFCSDESNFDDDKYEQTLEHYRQLWDKQGIPFTRYETNVSYEGEPILHLVPEHLLPIRHCTSPLHLLNCIVTECGLHPQNLSIHVGELHQAVCNLKAHYTASEDCCQFLKSLFKSIVILSLKYVSSRIHGDTIRCIMETAVKDENSTLKALELKSTQLLNLSFLSPYLFTLTESNLSSPRYQGLSILQIDSPVQPSCLPQLTSLIEQQQSLGYLYLCLLDSCLNKSTGTLPTSAREEKLYDNVSKLFSRKNFQNLRVTFACTRSGVRKLSTHKVTFPFTNVLHGFMSSTCTHNQTLRFENIYGDCSNQNLLPLPRASPAAAIPLCETEHKMLKYDFVDMNLIISHLLQLPVIKLRELAFSFDEQNQSLFSQLCHHPNLNVAHFLVKFALPPIIDLQEFTEPHSSLCHDFERLFQMPSLKEFSLSGEWLCFGIIKKALAVGLQQQSRVSSLRKIYLTHNFISHRNDPSLLTCRFTESEDKQIWSAIFSLPQVDQLEVNVSMETRLTESFIDMAQIVYICWREFSNKCKKLRLLQLSVQKCEHDEPNKIDLLREVTSNLVLNE